jgi:hypothetical protein
MQENGSENGMRQAKYAFALLALTAISLQAQDAIFLSRQVHQAPDKDGVFYAGPKDTARNIRRTGEFVVNVVTEDIAEKMNICAADFPPGMSEVELAGFTTAPSQLVKPPRLAEAHAALEDRYLDPSGPYIKADEMHSFGRMNGLGNYVRTRDAFMTIPRISYEEWKSGKR